MDFAISLLTRLVIRPFQGRGALDDWILSLRV